jgi:hypothetical protein
MGLHRDPGRSRYSRDVAERRRWAWWHIILLERFVVSIRPCSRAYSLISYRLPEDGKRSCLVVPSLSPPITSTHSYHPTAHLNSIRPDDFTSKYRSVPPRLHPRRDHGERCFVAPGHIRDFQTQRPVACRMAGDSTPRDRPRLPRSLSGVAIPAHDRRRIAVQSIITRTAFYHIRFTLHRPYAIGPDSEKTRESRKIAIDSAEKLLALAKQTSPGYLDGNTQIIAGDSSFHPRTSQLETLPRLLCWDVFHVPIDP